MDRCQLPLDSSALSFTHANNTLIVSVSHYTTQENKLIFMLHTVDYCFKCDDINIMDLFLDMYFKLKY